MGQLGVRGQHLSAEVAGEHLLGHELAGLVDVVLADPVAVERGGRGVGRGAVLAGEGARGGVLGLHVVLEGLARDEALLAAELAGIDHARWGKRTRLRDLVE